MHVNESRRKATTHKHHWIRSLLAEGLLPIIERIESGFSCAWVDAEITWVAHYRDAGANLTNSTNGGEGSLGVPNHALGRFARNMWASRTKEERSAIAKARSNDPAVRDKIRRTLVSRTPEQRAESTRKRLAHYTPEKYAAIAAKRNSKVSTERWSAIARERQSRKSPEEIKRVAIIASHSISPEQRSRNAKERQLRKPPEDRSAIARRRDAAMTPEQRSDRARNSAASSARNRALRLAAAGQVALPLVAAAGPSPPHDSV